MDTPNKHKHLEFIQASINRMSGNLFLLKGWSITLIAGLFTLAAKDTNKAYNLIAIFPLFVFWTLDAYFLSMERRFRAISSTEIGSKQGDSTRAICSLKAPIRRLLNKG